MPCYANSIFHRRVSYLSVARAMVVLVWLTWLIVVYWKRLVTASAIILAHLGRGLPIFRIAWEIFTLLAPGPHKVGLGALLLHLYSFCRSCLLLC